MRSLPAPQRETCELETALGSRFGLTGSPAARRCAAGLGGRMVDGFSASFGRGPQFILSHLPCVLSRVTRVWGDNEGEDRVKPGPPPPIHRSVRVPWQNVPSLGPRTSFGLPVMS